MLLYKTLLTSLMVALTACEAAELLPAQRLASQNGNNENKALLEQEIARMLNQDSILLADDVFVDSSEVVIERRPLTDDAGLRIQGRELQAPLHFRLWKQGNVCLLEYVATGEMKTIHGLGCTETEAD